MFELRKGGVTFFNNSALLVLRETKMGQRLGIHQQTTVTDPWLCKRLRALAESTADGQTLLGMTPSQYRGRWIKARTALGIAKSYTPYSLRRGGATAFFQSCGSFDRVTDVGRWGCVQICRLYISSALLELATAAELRPLDRSINAAAEHLHCIPV